MLCFVQKYFIFSISLCLYLFLSLALVDVFLLFRLFCECGSKLWANIMRWLEKKCVQTILCIVVSRVFLSLSVRLPSVEMHVWGLLLNACNIMTIWFMCACTLWSISAPSSHFIMNAFESKNRNRWKGWCYKSNKNNWDNSKCFVIRINYMENYLLKTSSCWGWNNVIMKQKVFAYSNVPQKLSSIVKMFFSFLSFGRMAWNTYAR